jgi:hypothetical protein
MFFLAFDVTTACWSGQLSNKFNAAQSLVRRSQLEGRTRRYLGGQERFERPTYTRGNAAFA